ncbi:hypothetical protein VNO78_01741 [Psophocarpus tetragonolobus]|uniref:RWP-RK domain-containing protein n=1 Tax=Psophocarpus tetragonolobus TaxID=3891 RepID=A0AAN9SZU4_PSOTE
MSGSNTATGIRPQEETEGNSKPEPGLLSFGLIQIERAQAHLSINFSFGISVHPIPKIFEHRNREGNLVDRRAKKELLALQSARLAHRTCLIMGISPLEGFPALDWAQQLPYSSNRLCLEEFRDLENLTLDFNLPPLGEDFEELVEQKPSNIVVPLSAIENGFAIASGCVKKEQVLNVDERPVPVPLASATSISKKRSSALEFEEIKNHFDLPINEAAKQMNVGLTMLKRRCRELNIMRWPHRKIKSLQLLIHNVKELGLTDEVPMLEKHKMMLEKLPGLELSKEAKKLRQACFKANYKRRCMELRG